MLVGRPDRAGVIDTGAVWVYDPNAKSWTAAAPYTADPAKYVDHPGAACLDGKVYLIGGLLKAGVAVKAVYAYDPTSNIWTPKADLPQPRGATGVAVYGRQDLRRRWAGLPRQERPVRLQPDDQHLGDQGADADRPRPLDLQAIGGKLYAIGGRTECHARTNDRRERGLRPGDGHLVGAARDAHADTARGDGLRHAARPHPDLGWRDGGREPERDSAGVFKQGHDYDPKTNSWIAIADELTPAPWHGRRHDRRQRSMCRAARFTRATRRPMSMTRLRMFR